MKVSWVWLVKLFYRVGFVFFESIIIRNEYSEYRILYKDILWRENGFFFFYIYFNKLCYLYGKMYGF